MRQFQFEPRKKLHATLSLIVLLLFTGTPDTHPPDLPNDKLNIIVILADDVSAEEFGCYGGTIPTPNIDKLASEGVRFKTAFGTPMCTPSRAMLLTGLYPDKTGVFHNSLRPLRKDGDSRWHWGHAFDLFPEVFQRNGYRTLIAGKWQMDGQYPDLGFDFGFDEYCLHHEWVRQNGWNQPDPKHTRYSGLIAGDQDLFPDRTSGYWYPSVVVNGLLVKTTEDDFGPDIFNDYVLNFVERNQHRPFMVYYPMMLAHTVTDFQSRDRSDKEKQFHQIFTRCPEVQNGRLTGKMGRESFQTNLEYLDFLVGRLMNKLDKLGIREKTLVVFTSDNATLGKGKACASPRGSHIPMIVSCPGVVQQQVVRDALVSLVDIYPTVTHLAGVSDIGQRAVGWRRHERRSDRCQTFFWKRLGIQFSGGSVVDSQSGIFAGQSRSIL